MTRIASRGLGLFWLFPLLIAGGCSGCSGAQKQPDVAEGFKLCKYCCTTANTSCSCEVLEVVECPEPDKTGILPACAECRSCTKRIEPNETCASD